MCFEILGFDILVDDKLKPWLIEINHSPSFDTDTQFDFKLKKDILGDTLEILNMSFQKKKRYQRQYRNSVQKRMFTFSPSKYLQDPTGEKLKELAELTEQTPKTATDRNLEERSHLRTNQS